MAQASSSPGSQLAKPRRLHPQTETPDKERTDMATTADNGRNNKTAVEQPGPADQADTQRLGEAHSKKRKRNHTKVIHRSNNAFIPDTVTITTGTRSAQKAKVQFSEKIIRAIDCLPHCGKPTVDGKKLLPHCIIFAYRRILEPIQPQKK